MVNLSIQLEFDQKILNIPYIRLGKGEYNSKNYWRKTHEMPGII